MKIHKYPGSSEYQSYSIDGNHTQFWIDGNTNGVYDNLPRCVDGRWCDLQRIDLEGDIYIYLF